MTNAIQQAINTAQAAAANFQPAANPVAPQNAGANQVAPVVERGENLTVEDMLAGGLSVVAWAKYNAFGFALGDDTELHQELEVIVDLSQVAYCYQIKYNLNGQIQYKKSYDRTTEVSGGSWMQTIQQAQAIDPRSYEYRSAEIPVMVLEDVKGKSGVSVHKGESFGLGLSTTAWRNWQQLIDTARRQGIDAANGVVKLKLGHNKRSKQGVNDWGVPTFTLIEELETLPILN